MMIAPRLMMIAPCNNWFCWFHSHQQSSARKSRAIREPQVVLLGATPAAILFLLSSLPYFALVCAATYSAERCDNRLSDPTSTVVSTPLHDVNPAEKPKSFIARFQQKASSAKMISHLSISTMIFDVIRRALLPFPLSSPSVFSMISTRTHRAKVLKVLKCSSHLRFLLAFLVAVLVIILC